MSDVSGSAGVATMELVANGVSKVFETVASSRPFVALDNVSIDVPHGRFLAIIGPSGCGKSTLLRILSGLTLPTAGEVFHAGTAVTGPDASRGFVFQADAVFPWLTVQKNIEFGPRSRGMDRVTRRALSERWAKAVGLGEFMHAYPKELSGGMRKRVDLARVYANGPDVLFMDEPFGALDAQTKERMQNDLATLWQTEQKTVVFVTHDVDEAVFLADEVIVMSPNPGRIADRISIELARPRANEARTTDAFVDARRRLRAVLKVAEEGVPNFE